MSDTDGEAEEYRNYMALLPPSQRALHSRTQTHPIGDISNRMKQRLFINYIKQLIKKDFEYRDFLHRSKGNPALSVQRRNAEVQYRNLRADFNRLITQKAVNIGLFFLSPEMRQRLIDRAYSEAVRTMR